jgi:proline iminopeptidase
MPETASTQPIAGSVSVDGAQLHYVVEGQGHPTLVVGSSTYYRRTFGQPFKKLLRCAFLDHRGFTPGATTGAQDHYTIDLITDDVEHVRRALGWDQVVVYGHSIHGLMALEYARRYPAHVSHVVMEGTPATFGGEEFSQAVQDIWDTATPERKARLERNRLGIEERLQGMSGAEVMVANYVANGPKLWADPTYDSSPLWDGVGINVELFNQIYGSIFGGYDVVTRQPPVTAPIFVAMGRHDYAVPFTTWDERRRSIGDLTFVLFEQSGHTPHLEVPEHFAEELARWLGQHRQQAARR